MRKINMRAWSLAAALALVSLLRTPSGAADDPSIKGALRDGTQASMGYFIETKTIKGVFPLYDPVEGKLLRLTFQKLHEGIVKKGDFYVSCADFTDPEGRKYDLDFLVIPDGDALRTLQALVHSVDGKKRAYHLESN